MMFNQMMNQWMSNWMQDPKSKAANVRANVSESSIHAANDARSATHTTDDRFHEHESSIYARYDDINDGRSKISTTNGGPDDAKLKIQSGHVRINETKSRFYYEYDQIHDE